jgi:DDE superfamily endonuclease
LCRHAPGDRWFAGETYVKVGGRWTYLYRAIDQHGQVIDVLLSARGDLAAARRFFVHALRAGTIPAEVTTDRAPAYRSSPSKQRAQFERCGLPPPEPRACSPLEGPESGPRSSPSTGLLRPSATARWRASLPYR